MVTAGAQVAAVGHVQSLAWNFHLPQARPTPPPPPPPPKHHNKKNKNQKPNQKIPKALSFQSPLVSCVDPTSGKARPPKYAS